MHRLFKPLLALWAALLPSAALAGPLTLDAALRSSSLDAKEGDKAAERIVAIEASHAPEWYRWVGRQGLVIGLDRFGASAPAEVLAEKFGFTGPQVAARVKAWLATFAATVGR